MNCHFCNTELQIKIDLGRQPLANALLDSPDQEEFFYDAKWGWCPECQLLQLANPPSLEQMFTGDYPFITDSSDVMVEHFKKTAQELRERYDLKDKIVVEIGCNSGGMIEHLPDSYRVGYETSLACLGYLAKKHIVHFREYFNEETAKHHTKPVDLIYSANTLRSVPQLESIFRGAFNILKDDGVFVIEEPYLMSILEGGEIDQFYDENVYCFTASAMSWLAARYGFTLSLVEKLQTHGGSMRYHLIKEETPTSHTYHPSVKEALGIEADIPEMLDKFWIDAQKTSIDFSRHLQEALYHGYRIVGYGATAKSSTMLNFSGIDYGIIKCIYDTTAGKIGKYTPGTHIPIRDARDFQKDDAEIVCLFAWNHQEEIIARENKTKDRKWLLYVANVHYA